MNSKLDVYLVVLCFIISATWLPRGAAFPRESVGGGWVKKTTSSPKQPQLLHREDGKFPAEPSPQQFCTQKLNVLLQRKMAISAATVLSLSRDSSEELEEGSGEEEEMNLDILEKRGKRSAGRRYRSGGGRGFARGGGRGGANATTAVMDVPADYVTSAATPSPPSEREIEMTKRLTQLEHLVAKQTVEIRRLKDECKKLTEVSQTFAQVVELLREAGLQTEDLSDAKNSMDDGDDDSATTEQQLFSASDESDEILDTVEAVVGGDDVIYEYFDDTEIFGEAPASVTDAADAAGAAILAGILGGKQRMLVDVRDSELSRDSEILVQFIELAILPVAAGLEGLKSNRNRVKIVFPTVSQLLEYRRTMALAAPEVVSLSTLGFDPVEERDNIVVIVAPPPNDEEGLQTMNELLNPSPWNRNPPISQPVVVLNHHMVPLSGPAADFDVMYHLRLLSVQYMAGEKADEIFQQFDNTQNNALMDETSMDAMNFTGSDRTDKPDEALLEAAMKHAHEEGVHHGMTRAMVIRSYPKPWHVFVDVSPDTDADFVVADTFTEEPTSDEVNNAIVECLEGSEREDELVAQQMQQALDMKNGNLDLRDKNGAKEGEGQDGDDEEDDDDFDDWYGLWTEDSV